MTATFVPPTPNCGHRDVTYTHNLVAQLWLCVRCCASMLGLDPRCHHCGRAERNLLSTKHGRLCLTCFTDARYASRT